MERTRAAVTGWAQCVDIKDVIVMPDFETDAKEVDVHYVNEGVPFVIEENFEGYYHDHGDYLLSDVLQHQEIVYQSLQGTRGNDVARASSPSHPRSDHDHGQGSGSTGEGNLSRSVHNEFQLARDEALARELQSMEDNLAATFLSEATVTAAESSSTPVNNVTTATGISALAAEQDDIDPDNMTYEELQSLGETVGTEGRGLSDELISTLPSSTYKTGFFSRKENEECVICCMPYKNREVLITLPCKHHYHSHCVKKWLQINKVCPVCNQEVRGSE